MTILTNPGPLRTSNKDQKTFLKHDTFGAGMRSWRAPVGWCLMNMFLHGDGEMTGDSLCIPRPDALIFRPFHKASTSLLGKPPFGKKSSNEFYNAEGDQGNGRPDL